MKGFLYGQTEYNLLKSSIKIDDYIKKAKELSFDFLSITDANMYGHYKFYNECIKEGIKPLIGLEYSFKTLDGNYSKLILYANNNLGYKNLIKISSKVKIDKISELDDIKDYIDNISVIFVFNNSFLERLVNSQDKELLNDYLLNIKNMNGYIGIGAKNKFNPLNDKIINLAKDYDIKILPIHQAKYFIGDEIVCETLEKIGGYDIEDYNLYDYSFDETPNETKELDTFVNNINLDLFKEKIALPKYPNTKNVSSKDYLWALCFKGIEKRKKNFPNYFKRLEYELNVIDLMGFNDYFLIVWDFIKYAKKNDILVGSGRGSACGSLVAYSLGITDIDPIENGLFFERFLNPERVTMPDIDTDFADIKRDNVIDYVRDFYGNDHVFSIVTFGTFKDKLALREIGRVMSIDKTRLDGIIGMLKNNSLLDLLKSYNPNDDIYNLFYIAKKIEGMPRNTSTHASGIVLSSASAFDSIPLQEGINGINQSQIEAYALEEMGFLKMDFLGISTLSMLKGILDDLNFKANDLKNISYNDKNVYKLLSNGDTLGVFQLEKEGMQKTLRELKPERFDDLVAAIALYRPGPMDNIPLYIRRRHGEKFDYIHEDLKPILNYTYGIIVYQEQIMQIAQKFAGYSLGEADVLRRAVSKKKEDLMLSQADDFIKRSVKLGYDEKIAKEIFDLIIKFANYGFNKAHSVAYATLAYQMAYFKVNNFNVFMANMLNNVISDKNKLEAYITYAKKRGVVIYKPNVNISTSKFVVNKVGLFMPLLAIKELGINVTNDIVKNREENGLFKNYDDFKNRLDLQANVIEALIYSGALDCFGLSKKRLINNYTKEQNIINRFLDDVIEDNSEFDFDYLKEMEYKYLSMNISYNLYYNIDELRKKYKAFKLSDIKPKNQAKAIISFTNIKEIKTKNNDLMVLGDLEDDTMKYRFVMFPRIYNELNFKLEKSRLYLVLGVIEKDNKDSDSFTILKIAEIKK